MKKHLKKIYLSLILGESTGIAALKFLLKIDFFKISYIVSSDEKYDKIIKKISAENKITFFTKKKFKRNLTTVLKISKKNDYLISIFSRIIVPLELLKKFKKHCLNIHPGVLPFYPGLNCVSGAIYNNEKYTGVTMHEMSKKPDQGRILFIKKIKIRNNYTPLIIMPKLRIATISLLKKFSSYIKKDKTKFYFKKNNIKKRINFPKFIPNDGLINQNNTSEDIFRTYKASMFGFFKSEWGNINIIFKKKKYFFRPIASFKRNSKIKNKKFLEKKEESFYLNLKDKKIKIEILNNVDNISKDLNNNLL